MEHKDTLPQLETQFLIFGLEQAVWEMSRAKLAYDRAKSDGVKDAAKLDFGFWQIHRDRCRESLMARLALS